MASVNVKHPQVLIAFNGKDSTQDLAPILVEVSYTDNTHGESDEIDLEFEDRSQRFKKEWMENFGLPISVKIGYSGESFLDCGHFELESVDFSGPPDKVKIHGVATVISSKLRTKKHKGYEHTTLSAIVNRVAQENGLTLKGDIEDIQIDRSTQNHEKDLAYLRRVAHEYGYAFSVKGKTLSFYKIEDLENKPSGLMLRRDQMSEYSFNLKAIGGYSEATISHHHAKSKKRVSAKVAASDVGTSSGVTTQEGYALADITSGADDTLEVISRSQDSTTARIKARSKLHRANREQATGEVTLFGAPQYVAGITLELVGLGRLGGPYFIDSAKHTVTRGAGWVTTLNLKRPGDPSKASLKKSA
jgi:phage protein D